MASIWNANLTDSEIERYAYIYGKRHLATYAACVEDQDELETRHAEELEAAREESFAEGKAEGLGIDAADEIEALEAEVTKLKASHQRCRDNLQAVSEWLQGDGCKTVTSRKEYVKRLRTALSSTPRY